MPRDAGDKRSCATHAGVIVASPLEDGIAPVDKHGVLRRVITPLLTVAALSLAAVLLYRTLSGFDPGELVASVTSFPPARLLPALAFAGASYLCLTDFDWLALRYVGRPLSYSGP